MRWYIFIAAALGLAGCNEYSRESRVISAIERQIQLPTDAYPLRAYSRVYAYAPDNKVVAIYLLPSKPDQRLCEEEKEIERKENGEGASQFCLPPKGLIAGEQRWIKDYQMLPGAHDGGCKFIDVQYDLNSKNFLQVACHGEVG
ncbi:hypothetical protein [Sphingobium sp.]|uniref:hypothetical protein n=1 Tax=Sphingobium sp. TaxID=1912891 RepID=UPI0028BE2FEA|nr:hypothetical protein [Sphingobium sp.]